MDAIYGLKRFAVSSVLVGMLRRMDSLCGVCYFAQDFPLSVSCIEFIIVFVNMYWTLRLLVFAVSA